MRSSLVIYRDSHLGSARIHDDLPIKRYCVEIESFPKNPACELLEFLVRNGALVFMIVGLIVFDFIVDFNLTPFAPKKQVRSP